MSVPEVERGQVTLASIAGFFRSTQARGEVIWPWPPSIVIDDPDTNIETYLVAAMNYIDGLAASSMVRDEQDRTSMAVIRGLVEHGLLLSRARREGLET